MTLPQLHELRAQASLNAAKWEQLRIGTTACQSAMIGKIIRAERDQYKRIQELINVSDENTGRISDTGNG